MPDTLAEKTLSFDGKTVRSTAKMDRYTSPLHIISAQIGELGITLGQYAVQDKENEIPAVQELLKLLDISGAVVVADALNCQKETAKIIAEKGANYMLSVKDNQKNLKKDIEDYVQDEEFRATMETSATKDYQGGRIEKRTEFATSDNEWHYCISRKK